MVGWVVPERGLWVGIGLPACCCRLLLLWSVLANRYGWFMESVLCCVDGDWKVVDAIMDDLEWQRKVAMAQGSSVRDRLWHATWSAGSTCTAATSRGSAQAGKLWWEPTAVRAIGGCKGFGTEAPPALGYFGPE